MNSLIVFLDFDNNSINKKEIPFDIFSRWTSLEDIRKFVKKDNCKFKYFDEEKELISIQNTEDFFSFQNIATNKKFRNNEVVVIAYDNEFDKKKFGCLKKLHKLKIRRKHRDSYAKNTNANSSSSSSSCELSRSKKHKSVKKYAADVKKELNYLSGSEVSDGQTILKKWRIKNIGLKKWKANTVKCVLLPSEYSDWISYEDIKVPVCFADQKVDIEMEIKIIGRWTSEQLSNVNCCQTIKLKWLLFMDKLVNENETHFMDFILGQVDLKINVKNRNHESMFPDPETPRLTKQTSESSIEKIDQDFSLVDISNDDENIKSSEEIILRGFVVNDVKRNGIFSELDLPDCPNGGDFQITDFHLPNNIISVEKANEEKKSFDNTNDDSILQMLNQPDIANKNQILDIVVENQIIDSVFNDLKDTEEIAIDENATIDEIVNIVIVGNEDDNNESGVAIQDLDNEVGTGSNETDELIESDCVNENKSEETDRNGDTNDTLTNGNLYHSDALLNKIANEVKRNLENEEANVEDMSPPINNALVIENSSNVKTQQSLDFGERSKPDITPLIINDKYPTENNHHPNEINSNQIQPNLHKPIKIISNGNHINHYPPNGFPNNIPYLAGVGLSNVYCNPCVPNAPPFVQINQVPIQNQSSQKVIRELTKNGNIHNNINDAPWVNAENGQHYETTTNLIKLKEMGFIDEARNYRLLMKFSNNLQDVIPELID